jgi:pseudouridine-5'-phosphate glycosidase
VTPFLLDRFAEETGGESLRVNKKIIEGNARLAARVAVSLAGLS